MKYFLRAFTPTKNRRLNELIGFLLFVSATLLFLALASYSPLDPSLNTAGSLSSGSAHNWIGLFGAMLSDLMLQSIGIFVFAAPVMIGLLGARWFKSKPVASAGAKALGAAILLIFTPALLALLPWHLRWMHAVAIEGLLGRIVGDILLHYFNTVGAYIVCGAVVAVAMYLSTAFSFVNMQIWLNTRFAFAYALWQRFQDWRMARAKVIAQKKAQKEAAKAAELRNANERGVILPAAQIARRRAQADAAPVKTGIERTFEDEEPLAADAAMQAAFAQAMDSAAGNADGSNRSGAGASGLSAAEIEPAINTRADQATTRKTVLPKIAAGGYKLPPSSLLHRGEDHQAINEAEVKALAEVLTQKCAEFSVGGMVTQINPGPVVTTYEFKPDAGVKYSRITSLSDDLCLALRAESILIERMPGKSTVGIQVPNHNRETIWLREVVESPEFLGTKSKLTLAMGKDINGRIITADLATMPHLLIAGSTGSGKSVAINAMIMSILYKSTPEQVRLILVDPKRLELGIYEGVPHLYVPIITEPKLAANALRNAVREMERRLKVLAAKGVRNLEQYNKLFESDTPSLFEAEGDEKPLPHIVIVIDELADLMMLDQSNVEESITRLAQMARAVGIHLVLATQRPSVDVITGLIKANFPSRISFRVATKIDSRTILDANGAESLLGKGDMLYLPSGSARVHRLHAPYTSEKETHAVVEFWRAQAQAQYEQKFLEAPKEEREGLAATGSGEPGDDAEAEHDELYHDAVRLVIEFGKASTSLLQRRLRIGYGRAAHLIDLMESDGIVAAPDGPKPREVLKKPDWLSEVEEALR
ncbi:MAG TPA: DNA translocase FtsK 4TM domain-containing protein [Candidatus Angelobacter sp.]|jgi:S-DNA-T family DNA segregation ATPase FtsK/SpoIIIE|nr:DNA translocase FtsK 4TM domain-containing protein [Candidatus Angelobacter sp.]